MVAWGTDTHLSTVAAALLASPLECTRAVLPGSHLVSRKTICPSPIQLPEEFCKNVKPDHGVPLLETLQGFCISRRPESKLLWCPRRLQNYTGDLMPTWHHFIHWVPGTLTDLWAAQLPASFPPQASARGFCLNFVPHTRSSHSWPLMSIRCELKFHTFLPQPSKIALYHRTCLLLCDIESLSHNLSYFLPSA